MSSKLIEEVRWVDRASIAAKTRKRVDRRIIGASNCPRAKALTFAVRSALSLLMS